MFPCCHIVCFVRQLCEIVFAHGMNPLYAKAFKFLKRHAFSYAFAYNFLNGFFVRNGSVQLECFCLAPLDWVPGICSVAFRFFDEAPSYPCKCLWITLCEQLYVLLVCVFLFHSGLFVPHLRLVLFFKRAIILWTIYLIILLILFYTYAFLVSDA